jgi:enolase-phosphatase E1
VVISQSVSVLPSLLGPDIRAALLDIEGTTTPVSFVYEVLFPFARARLREFLSEADIQALRSEYELEAPGQRPAWTCNSLGSAAHYADWLMDQDRKSTALKELQGKIWASGYADGTLKGIVYEDVPEVLESWRSAGVRIAIFSSGSVLAQKLIFANTQFGDLTPQIEAYFDTTTGPKREPESYRKIAESLRLDCNQVIFFSDITAELDAAQNAGMEVCLVKR